MNDDDRFVSTRQRLVVLTFDTAEDAERWEEQGARLLLGQPFTIGLDAEHP